MGSSSSKDMGYSQGEPAQYSSDFQSLQKAKRSGSYVPAPVPVVQWSEELFAEVENPTVWTPAEHLDWKVKFQYPSSWNIVDPVVEGNRFIRTVRTGFRHRDQHIFCTCELSIVITKLSDQFKSPDDFFDEVRILNTAASPDDSQESLTTMDGHPAIVTTNTFLQEDGTLTRVIDKHAFLPQARLGISVVAFFADSVRPIFA